MSPQLNVTDVAGLPPSRLFSKIDLAYHMLLTVSVFCTQRLA